MKISTEIGSISRHVGYEKAIEYVAKAGFDAFDLSMTDMARYNWEQMRLITDSPFSNDDYLKFVRKLKKVADDNGIVCNQSHAPFSSKTDLIKPYYKRAIECTAEVGGKICIIHPDNNKSAEENAQMYFEILPYAKECNVKIATENMWNWDKELDQALPAACSSHDDFLAHIKAVDDDDFVACLDIGHAEMKGLSTSAVDMVKTLGHHLQALHIHDNDLWHDDHKIPGSVCIDYPPIIKALKDIGYSGYFTLEVQNHLGKYTEDNIFEGVKELKKAAQNLAEMFETI